jgi:hypothetical protein
MLVVVDAVAETTQADKAPRRTEDKMRPRHGFKWSVFFITDFITSVGCGFNDCVTFLAGFALLLNGYQQ